MATEVIRTIPNKFAGSCRVCAGRVEAFAGHADLVVVPNRFGGTRERWQQRHHHCLASDGPTPSADDSGDDPTPYAPTPSADDSGDDPTPYAPTTGAPSLDDIGEALKDAPFVAEAEAVAKMMADALLESEARIVQGTAEHFTSTVPVMVEQHVARLLYEARPIAISIDKAPPVKFDAHHKLLPTILVAVLAGASPFLVGPAGSGKTTLAMQLAQALKRTFYMAARVTSEYKLTGFVDANGKCTRTQFREAYEFGGVFLFDEVDASDPDAMTAFNAALSNGHADFPDGMVTRHSDFVALAAGNTYGRGADRQYVGRNQLDAATLDRFQVFDVDYDEALELRLAGNDDWTRYVQSVRKAVDTEKVRHIVSPRASITGAKLLAAGMARAAVEDACIWKGLDAAQRQRIVGRI